MELVLSQSLFAVCQISEAHTRKQISPYIYIYYLWDNTFKPELFDYADIVNDDTGLRSAMHYLHRYGILLVSNTPANFDDTQKLAERIGFVRETLYGRMWSTRPDGSDVFD